MNYTNYKKGSEWRKWDLHVHTPFSHLSNGFGNDWDNYVQQLFKRAIANNISAIGITDYFTIDGYKKLKQEYLANDTKLKELFDDDEIKKIKTILVLPNVEFRLNKLVGANRINFHVILSDSVDINDIEENFLHEIDFAYEAKPQAEDEKRKLKINNLEQLGKKLIDQHEKFKDRTDVFIGMMNAVVDDAQVCSLLLNKRNLFEDKFLVALPCDEDLSKVSWNGQDHQARKLLIQKSDLLVATNPNTIDWALGKKHNDPKDFILEYKTLKPCIGGSDAHNFDELFVKNKDRQVWIKADLTFEGLRQIVYEPEDRVKIQASLPEDKAGYQIIDNIEISNHLKYNQSLDFNPNLNSIIGGRSTGKSILLGAIAKKLKPVRPIQYHDEDYNAFVQKIASSIRVIWKDGKEENNREIEYFQQGYMHEIARDENKLSKIIQDILNQKGKETILTSYTKSISDTSRAISGSISDFFQVLNTIADKTQKILDKGDKNGIEDEIKRLSLELSGLTTTSITTEEKEEYDRLKGEVNTLNQTKATIISDIQNIEVLKSSTLFKETISYETTSISEERRSQIDTIFSELKQEVSKKWIEKLDELITKAKESDTTVQGQLELATTNETYIKVSKAYSNDLQLTEYEQKIQIQKNKLFEITGLLEEVEILKKQRDALKDSIINAHKSFYQKTIDVVSQLSDTNDGLDIKAKPKFNEDQYRQILQSSINQQSYENQALSNFKYMDNEGYETHILGLFNELISDQLTLKGGYNNQTLINSLMSKSFYSLNYDLEYEGDDFKRMSDGKKAFVVLKLLLDFSNKDCPILIDQPEDDLDNRAIYSDLVKYLRKKKKLRQIIVATHNPNIVVGADSELVICANQHGDKSPNRDDKKFQYVSGSLEHTFENNGNKEILEAQGIREHVCEVLEGGNIAFKLREMKYALK